MCKQIAYPDSDNDNDNNNNNNDATIYKVP